MLWAAAVIYFVLIGGTDVGDVVAVFRLLNAALGAVVIAMWLRHLATDNDVLDRLVLGALLVFLMTCALSQFPRQSLDAGVAATAFAAAFYWARRELQSRRSRQLLMATFRLLLFCLGVGTVVVWGSKWLSWLNLHAWTSLPPLNMPLQSAGWGFQHDLVVMLWLLAPALLVGRQSKKRIALAMFGISMIALALVMDGSRNTVLALGLACGIVATRSVRRPAISRSQLVVGAVGIVVIVFAALALNLDDRIISRLTNIQALGMRVNQWSSALQLWTGSWLQGIGPGSYPFQMRLTDYFQQNSYVGRHPDDALIQILAETGVLGICAAGLLLASVVIMARRYQLPQANMFAILVFIFAGLGANPSEYGYLVIILILWVAHAFPAEPPHSTATIVSWIRPAIFTAAGVIALATMSMTGAAFAFERASANASEKDYNSAVAALSVASALDPGMALYRRERGVARAIIGDRLAALDDLRAAVSLNRADDVAYRSIAVVESQLGNDAEATRAASAAVHRVWSDLTNQEVLLRVAAPGSSESISAARASLLLAPWIGDTPAWKRLVAASIPRSELLANSIEPLVVGGVPFPDPFSAVWRAAADSRQKALEQVLEAVPQLRETGLSLRSFLACDASAALSRILAAESREGTDGAYWGVRLLIERQTGSDETRSLHVGSLLAPGLPDIAFGAAVPLDAFGGGARDLWGYRRLPVPHSAATWLVSSQEGQVAWMQRGFRSSACQA